MPWEIERVAKTVHVRISVPVGDWEALKQAVLTEFSPRPMAVLLPATIPDGTAEDDEHLRGLWNSLMDLGLPLQREPELPPSN